MDIERFGVNMFSVNILKHTDFVTKLRFEL